MTTDNPLPRYTPALVADPTPPLPHADPAPAAEAGTGAGGLEGPLIDKARRLWACNVADIDPARVAAAEGNPLRPLLTEAQHVIGVQKAAMEGMGDAYMALAGERDAALTGLDWSNAERDRLSAELAAVRGAMPGNSMLMRAASMLSNDHPGMANELRRAAAAVRALATATPTPPAAEAVTGGWTREAPTEPGLYWAMRRYDKKPVQARFTYRGGPAGRWIRIAVAGAGSYGQSEFVLFGPRVTPPDGWTQEDAS